MGLLLKLHLSSYVASLGDERCHIKLFNDHTPSIYVNGKCKHKHIRPFLNF